MTDFERFVELFKSLRDNDVQYVLIGGVALNIHGIPRATEDIDLFIRPDRGNVEKLRSALKSVWTDPDVDAINPDISQTSSHEARTVCARRRLGTHTRYLAYLGAFSIEYRAHC